MYIDLQIRTKFNDEELSTYIYIYIYNQLVKIKQNHGYEKKMKLKK